MQPTGLMISTTLRVVMICQTCGLDKKILQKLYPFLQHFLVEMRGVVSASTRCNREMSVLAQANERQPGSGVQACIFAHSTKGASPQSSKKKKTDIFVRLFHFWWRCGELNPGPKSLHRHFLHVYLTFGFFALWYVGEP